MNLEPIVIYKDDDGKRHVAQKQFESLKVAMKYTAVVSPSRDPKFYVTTPDMIKLEDLIEEMKNALSGLVCCPAFDGRLFEKDPVSHKSWTLGREALRKAEELLKP